MLLPLWLVDCNGLTFSNGSVFEYNPSAIFKPDGNYDGSVSLDTLTAELYFSRQAPCVDGDLVKIVGTAITHGRHERERVTSSKDTGTAREARVTSYHGGPDVCHSMGWLDDNSPYLGSGFVVAILMRDLYCDAMNLVQVADTFNYLMPFQLAGLEQLENLELS